MLNMDESDKKGLRQEDGKEHLPEDYSSEKPFVSQAVIKRLPRYFRYLRELIRKGQVRISSAELSQLMNVTASQIRQDLNCFGGFGQQGYGYNVNYLYAKICEILGVGAGFHAVIIGAGNLGMALVHSSMFEKRGVDIVAMFDVNPALIGKSVEGIPIFSMEALEEFCTGQQVDFAVLTMPKECAGEVVERLSAIGVKGAWNFTSTEMNAEKQDMVIENVHLGDSLMTLCYELSHRLPAESGDQKTGDGSGT